MDLAWRTEVIPKLPILCTCSSRIADAARITLEDFNMAGRFAWEYPILSFLASGWFVVAYLVYQPAFVKMMSEVPDGTVLNVVTPSMFLMMAVVINALGWTCGYFSSFEKEGE